MLGRARLGLRVLAVDGQRGVIGDGLAVLAERLLDRRDLFQECLGGRAVGLIAGLLRLDPDPRRLSDQPRRRWRGRTGTGFPSTSNVADAFEGRLRVSQSSTSSVVVELHNEWERARETHGVRSRLRGVAAVTAKSPSWILPSLMADAADA